MDPRSPTIAALLFTLILALFSLQSLITTEAASVVFLDSPVHQYLRSPSDPNALTETDSISLAEVSASVSVLLGYAPPATISAASSSKLNKVLAPNPFDRPHAVFALEVTGIKDSQLVGTGKFGGALKSKVLVGESKAHIQLPDEDEVSVISLNDLPGFDSDALSSDNELLEFATFLGGSYASNDLPLTGELTVPSAGDANVRLDLSKKAEMEFIISLVALLRKVERALVILEDLSGSGQKHAELITGSFDGIKVLQEHYGTDSVVQQGVELFALSIPKIFDYLEARYKGQIVGVIIHGEAPASESKKLLNVEIASRASPRWLEETKTPTNSTLVSEIVLVRRTIAWITGILLIIATLLGVYFLLYMPLTRDTLLYSNVKLD
ncbi:unnamed protein product [Coffea canephora]|uniref:DUF7794 domain-containing protein n=1 Tax=Coffea canephora TaxID=49390 RepID=A0A068TT19_COFCA|nr:unnamed protein product [Coffea canephora]